MTAEQAIRQSRDEDRIVTLDHEQEIANDLLAECDDRASGDGVTEYWGADWRVHLRTVDVDDAAAVTSSTSSRRSAAIGED